MIKISSGCHIKVINVIRITFNKKHNLRPLPAALTPIRLKELK
ncbi:hypothetical protein ATN83_3548 [Raoultella ornithinolytica]|nr:hypothetical protein ATN83_3548 [Raoultella ornithinolytica]